MPELARTQVVEVIVVDGGSSDGSQAFAAEHGARVVSQRQRGYGAACLTGALIAAGDVVVNLDGDYADDPADLDRIVEPVLAGRADLVIGARNGPGTESGALPLHQRLGNRLVTLLLWLVFGVRLTDIGSYRAIRRDVLLGLGMRQMAHGWPVEMIARSARRGYRVVGVPIGYRRRIGVSKVGGTLTGSLMAGYRMLATIVICAVDRTPAR